MSSDIHALSGAYAVDALDDIERAQFERHLAECDACRSEVESLREASAMLAETAAAAPPAALRDRVLAGIETVRPLPPVVPITTERRTRRFPALVAAAAVVTLIGVGGTVWQPWSDETSQSVSAADRVLSDPAAITEEVKLTGGGSVTLTRSELYDAAVIQAEDMPRLSSDEVYALWLQHDTDMVPAGSMTGAEAEPIVLEGDAATADGAGITVEPLPVPQEPTTTPIAYFPFKSV
ncbi:hypothetical protein NSZ01_25200 [Nocardioides szechwanensis]|uniref:Regulator of SigK n=1 Tax=Nocardioides szechwanensis TaxID=1005944 RepID=A0A1H0E7L1_9ACTN|nr:anti-sigma factor [Nocardioides szechwanensis]GEP34752.1 hypothetical protein NSZ01_25200 [Nocardioides szechwanensis]SDN78333.1 Putative zinc-finger [Nocardioides szechwanensis]